MTISFWPSALRLRRVLALALLMLGAAYAGADPLADAFAGQGEYLGSDTCLACHGKKSKAPFELTPMGHRFSKAPQNELEKKNCEACHGPGGKHADTPKVKGLIFGFGPQTGHEAALENAACLQCHTRDTKRHWEAPADFAASHRCAECHVAMRPTALVRASTPPTPELVAAVQKEFAGQYAGDALCVRCHANATAKYQLTRHARLLSPELGKSDLERKGCESCHGPGKAHAYSGGGRGVGGMITFREKGRDAVQRGNDACLQCHQTDRRDYWDGSEHANRNIACAQCHTLMERKSPTGQLSARTQVELCGKCHQTKRAQMYRNAHMPVREGKMDCSSCHNPHGSQTKAMLLGDSPNDTCYKCHAEKRGPFMWEHPVVGENCMACHDPHGSVRSKMLKLDPPRLCQQCHIEVLHPTEARLPANKFVIGRACLQCHAMIHGSNHPSGQSFTR